LAAKAGEAAANDSRAAAISQPQRHALGLSVRARDIPVRITESMSDEFPTMHTGFARKKE
jgi:hypothetical protein